METPAKQQRRARSTPLSSASAKSPSLPRTSTRVAAFGNDGQENQESDVQTQFSKHQSGVTSRKQGRLMGGKMAKEEQKFQKQQECAIRAQSRATADMAVANFKKAQVLQDQDVLSLFTMSRADLQQAQEYLNLRRDEELNKLRGHIAVGDSDVAQQQSEATKEANQNAKELRHANQNRVAPAPMRTPPSSLANSSGSEDEQDDSPMPILGDEFQTTEGDQFQGMGTQTASNLVADQGLGSENGDRTWTPKAANVTY